MASVDVVDPRRLPVLVRSLPRRAVIVAGHAWVLHRKLIVQIAAALMVAAAISGLYQAREALAAGAQTAVAMMQGKFAEAGFGIAEIRMTGQKLTTEAEIFTALAIEDRTSTVSYDVASARARVAELPAVAGVTVRKTYPGLLDVDVTEKVPVARWRVDGVTFLIDGQGEQIANAYGEYTELPLVVGDGAADDALVMIRALDQHATLKDGLVAVSRIADRRWDLIYDTGLRVQLPETGVAQALDNLVAYQSGYQLMDRDLATIDLRVHGMLAVRPNPQPDDKKATRR
jgi:cell division protein FtsQ